MEVTERDREAFWPTPLCFVRVSLSHHQRDADEHFRATVRDQAEVIECHFLTGEEDYLLKVAVRDYQDLEPLLTALAKCPGVDRLVTSIVLREVKRAAP